MILITQVREELRYKNSIFEVIKIYFFPAEKLQVRKEKEWLRKGHQGEIQGERGDFVI